MVALWFAAHSALSFSRTGIYLLGIGLVVALPVMSIRKLIQPQTVLILGLALVIGLVTWGFLMRFTEGRIGERFSSTSLTRRDLIAVQDIAIWKKNIILGAGVGSSSIAHSEGTAGRVGSHTEYTRLLAEHGLLGALAALMLLKMAARPWFTVPAGFTKAVLLSGASVTLAWMAVSAMRNAAPGLLIGMASAQWGLLPRVRRVWNRRHQRDQRDPRDTRDASPSRPRVHTAPAVSGL